MKCRILVYMIHVIGDPTQALDRALNRRGSPMTTAEFLDVLREIGGDSAGTLTQGESAFLLEHTDLAESDLSEGARAATRLEVATNRVALDRAVLDDALTTGQVAQLRDQAEANVRRSRINGDLYSPNAGDSRGLRFPRWQFTAEGHVVPGLRQIIPTFPPHTHPVVIEDFMTTSNEALENLSPVQWLVGGGAAAPVVELVDELGYE